MYMTQTINKTIFESQKSKILILSYFTLLSSYKNGHCTCVKNVLYIENQLLVMKNRNLRISFALIPADSSFATIIPDTICATYMYEKTQKIRNK